MFLKALNIKGIEKKKNSNILVVENADEKMGESLFRINDDAASILACLDGTHTLEDIAGKMSKHELTQFDQAKCRLQEFLNLLTKNYGIEIVKLKQPDQKKIVIYGNGKTQYPSAISLEITHRCNAKCRHCYGGFDCRKQVEDNTANLCKVLVEARKAGMCSVK